MTPSFDQWADDLAASIAKKSEQAAKPVYACDTCQDTGHHMAVVCYGGPTLEREVHCVDCAHQSLQGTSYEI